MGEVYGVILCGSQILLVLVKYRIFLLDCSPRWSPLPVESHLKSRYSRGFSSRTAQRAPQLVTELSGIRSPYAGTSFLFPSNNCARVKQPNFMLDDSRALHPEPADRYPLVSRHGGKAVYSIMIWNPGSSYSGQATIRLGSLIVFCCEISHGESSLRNELTT